jgi:hypothetical protein
MGRAEEWAVVREESRLLLEEADDERAFQADISSELRSPAWVDDLLGPSDPLEKWRRGQLEAEAARTAYRQREADDTNEQRTRDWDRYVRSHIERALAAYSRELTETLGGVVAEVRRALRSEFAAALAEYGARGDECVRQLRQQITKQRGVDNGGVVDFDWKLFV